MKKIYTDDRIVKDRTIKRFKDCYGGSGFLDWDEYLKNKPWENKPLVRAYKKYNGHFYYMGDLINRLNIETIYTKNIEVK